MRRLSPVILLCTVLLVSALKAQVMNLYTLPHYPDSLKMPRFNNLPPGTGAGLRMEYPARGLKSYNDYLRAMNVLPATPFELDTRGSSYYVPRMVRDELNLIMNRPRETAFVPVLGAAYIAVQLAQKYIFIEDKIRISADDFILAETALRVLGALWEKSPQSLDDLFPLENIYNAMSAKQLQTRIDLLIENKLVRQRLEKTGKRVYFAAIPAPDATSLVEAAAIKETDPEKKKKLRTILWKLHNYSTDAKDTMSKKAGTDR